MDEGAEDKWLRFTLGDRALAITPWPDRKQVSLCIVSDGVHTPVAWFKSKEAALEVQNFIVAIGRDTLCLR